MKSTVIALTFTTLSVLLGPSSPAVAGEAKVARGTVASIGAKSVTVTVGGQDMVFSVDSKTLVETRGGSTKSSRAAASGKPGPQLSELLTAGQPERRITEPILDRIPEADLDQPGLRDALELLARHHLVRAHPGDHVVED